VKIIAKNRRARFDFTLEKEYTAGIVLQGTEVKAIREGKISIDGSYARVIGTEVYAYGIFIGEYSKAPAETHKTDRRRKLLLRKHEILKIKSSLKEKGMTLVPVAVSFSERNLVKVEVALARSKSKRDKRESIKKRDAERHIRNIMRN